MELRKRDVILITIRTFCKRLKIKRVVYVAHVRGDTHPTFDFLVVLAVLTIQDAKLVLFVNSEYIFRNMCFVSD